MNETAAGDRPGWRCGWGAAAPPGAVAGRLVLAGLAWNYLDYLAGWGPVASHTAISFLPYFACGMLVALLVEARRARGRPPLGQVASAALVALRRRCWSRTGSGTHGDHASLAMEVFADSAAARVRGDHRVARARHRHGGAVARDRPARLDGRDRVRLLPVAHPAARARARPRAIFPPGIVLGLAVLPVAIAFGAASWYLVERPLMRRAARAAAQRRGGRRRRGPAVEGRGRYRSQVRTIAFANPSP